MKSGNPFDSATGRAAGQRVDKWLWHARFARTRTAAQALARSGHIRHNRVKVTSPSRVVRAGDVLTIALGRGVRVVEVRGFAKRRGAADIARTLYVDRTPAPLAGPVQEAPAAGARPPAPVATKRPDKRDRRRLAALKRSPADR